MTGSHAATPAEDAVLAQAVSDALDSDPAQTAVLVQVLHRRVHDPETLLDLMGRVSREAVNILDGVRWAGVTAQLDGRPFTAAISDDRTLLIDHQQYKNNDGPCITAMR